MMTKVADEESKSWGKREIADEGEDNAELVDDDDPVRLDDVGNGTGRPVMIFVAGRMSLTDDLAHCK